MYIFLTARPKATKPTFINISAQTLILKLILHCLFSVCDELHDGIKGSLEALAQTLTITELSLEAQQIHLSISQHYARDAWVVNRGGRSGRGGATAALLCLPLNFEQKLLCLRPRSKRRGQSDELVPDVNTSLHMYCLCLRPVTNHVKSPTLELEGAAGTVLIIRAC